jgi:hypothetical protein
LPFNVENSIYIEFFDDYVSQRYVFQQIALKKGAYTLMVKFPHLNIWKKCKMKSLTVVMIMVNYEGNAIKGTDITMRRETESIMEDEHDA